MPNVHKFGKRWMWDHSLRDKSFINELEHAYYSFLISNYGPNSCLSLIQNSAGGNFLTSSSHLFLQQLSFGHPCFKFINALISSQNRCHGVHGLFVGILCSGLLLQGLKYERDIPHRVLREVSEWIQFSLLEELKQHNNRNLFCKLNLGILNEILCVTRTVVKSKSFCCVSEEELNHLSLKIIEAFLATLPESTENDFGQIHILDIEGMSSINSNIISGILYRMPEYSIEELQNELKINTQNTLKIIVFTVPLSHEVQKNDSIEWHSKSHIKSIFFTSIITILRDLLIKKGVKIIANQMYIHEELKYSLSKEGFLVLERLGTSMTNSLIKMASCSPITSLNDLQSRIDHHIGSIPAIEAKTINEKHYIHIHSQVSHQDVSFVLMAESIHSLAYLKECVETGVSLLRQMIKDSNLVAGAGCFEVYIAILLTKMKNENFLHLSQSFRASTAYVKMVFDGYVDIFLRLSVLLVGAKHGSIRDYYADSEVFHLWKTSPHLDETIPKERSNDTSAENPEIEQRCACSCIAKCDLSNNVHFISLYNIKNYEMETHPNGNFRGILNFAKIVCDESVLKLHSDSIVDSFAAKLNAIRFAFDGFSELFRLGLCIGDS